MNPTTCGGRRSRGSKTRRRRHRISEGVSGGAVYAGVDGCVFVPALKSKGEGLLGLSKYTRANTKYVTKMFANSETVWKEKRGFDIMKSVDPRGEYTRTFYDMDAVPDLSSVLPTEKCMHPLHQGDKGMYIEYGGVSLDTLERQGKLSMYIKPILQGLKNLSNLFLKMSSKGIAHNDVHEGNILFDKTTNRVYLIDYTGIETDVKGVNLVGDMTRLLDVIQWVTISIQLKANPDCSEIITRFMETSKKIKHELDVKIVYNFINDYIPSVINFCSKDGAISRTSSDGKSSAASPPRIVSDGSHSSGSSRLRQHRKTRRKLHHM